MTIQRTSSLTDEAIERLRQSGKILAAPVGYPDHPRDTGMAFALTLGAIASLDCNSPCLLPKVPAQLWRDVDLATFDRALTLLAESVALYRRIKLVLAGDDILVVPFCVDLERYVQAGETFA